MEILLACAILLYEDLISAEEYRRTLDRLFLEERQSAVEDILLELEWNQSDIKQSVVLIRSYCAEHAAAFDNGTFGRFLFGRLQKLYSQGMDIQVFAHKMYCLWENLPPWLQDTDPFHTLSYADDPLSWGDVEQTRRIYETLFDSFAGQT